MTSAVVHTAIMAGFILLETVVYPLGLIRGAAPDLALVILCFSANHHGSSRGELAGFTSGIVEDALSLSPLGFHAIIRATIGFLYGLTRSNLFIDPVLLPVVIVAVATLMKALLAYLFAAIFAQEIAATVFSAPFGLELLMNALVAPFVYGLLQMFGMISGKATSRL